MFDLNTLIYVAPAIIITVTLHELAHGWVSYKFGDPTPKEDGRLSLNPLRHLDPIGTIALLVAGFGWGKRCISIRDITRMPRPVSSGRHLQGR